jgi:putative phosphoribosyl transferase
MLLTLQQYRDRIEAGQVLARHLAAYAHRVDTLVLALPRGGVPVGAEVAAYLNAPLDAFIVRKLGLPENPEVAMGAIASGGVRVLDDEVIARAGVSAEEVAHITMLENAELMHREQLYRGRRPPPEIAGRVVILVDDGLATGFSMHAAVIALHRQQPAWLVVAAPVGSEEACAELAQEVHEVVCPLRPEPFQAVGLSYDHFAPVDDDAVHAGLRRVRGLQRP